MSQPLVPRPPFTYMSADERADLRQAFVDAGVVYNPPARDSLLDGVNRQFVANFLPIVGFDPLEQLSSDLRRMCLVERLTDGTVPLAQWLRNAARRFSVLPQRSRFEDALRKVAGQGESTAPVAAAADAPPLDFEEIITDGIDDFQNAWFLADGASRVASVAKMLVPRVDDGKPQLLPDGRNPSFGSGTGWLIAGDLILTNHHVLRNRRQGEPQPSPRDLLLQAQGIQAHFFFDADGQQGRKIAVAGLVAAGEAKTEDFALLRLAERPQVAVLPVRDEPFKLPAREATPKGTVTRALGVNIIQHPGGGPKRVALRNNLVYSADYPRVHYFTDTLGGSSGSPVFDDTWRVVAMHRATVPTKAELNGKLLGYVNEGIQIHAILAALRQLAAGDAKIAEAVATISHDQAAFAEG